MGVISEAVHIVGWTRASVCHGLKSEAEKCPASQGRKRRKLFSPLGFSFCPLDSGLFSASDFSPWQAPPMPNKFPPEEHNSYPMRLRKHQMGYLVIHD